MLQQRFKLAVMVLGWHLASDSPGTGWFQVGSGGCSSHRRLQQTDCFSLAVVAALHRMLQKLDGVKLPKKQKLPNFAKFAKQTSKTAQHCQTCEMARLVLPKSDALEKGWFKCKLIAVDASDASGTQWFKVGSSGCSATVQ